MLVMIVLQSPNKSFLYTQNNLKQFLLTSKQKFQVI